MVNVHKYAPRSGVMTAEQQQEDINAQYEGRELSCERLNCTYTNKKCEPTTPQDNAFLISPRDIVSVIRATQDPFNYFIEESGIAMMKEEEACKNTGKVACKAEDNPCEWDVGNAQCRTTTIEEAKRDLRTRKMHKVKCR